MLILRLYEGIGASHTRRLFPSLAFAIVKVKRYTYRISLSRTLVKSQRTESSTLTDTLAAVQDATTDRERQRPDGSGPSSVPGGGGGVGMPKEAGSDCRT